MPDTCFHLIRHASTDALGTTLSGRTATSLNAQGEAEAERLARTLAGIPVDAILSSPQRRTLQTAHVLGQVFGLAAQPNTALDEVDFGAWTGQLFTALAGCPDWMLWNMHRSLAPAPGTETMLQVQARVASLVQRLRTQHPAGSFVLVSHADVLKSLIAWALGSPIDLMQRLEIAPASRSLLILTEAGMRVGYVNMQV